MTEGSRFVHISGKTDATIRAVSTPPHKEAWLQGSFGDQTVVILDVNGRLQMWGEKIFKANWTVAQ